MKIQRLAVENFKSFDRLDLELGDFNVFIGANASGKSNVLHILQFLRDIAASGLRNAVSMQGGVEFLRNVQVGEARATKLSFAFLLSQVDATASFKGGIAERGCYDLVLRYENEELYISDDQAKLFESFFEFEKSPDGLKEKRKVTDFEYILRRENGGIRFRVESDENPDLAEASAVGRNVFEPGNIDDSQPILESPYFAYPYSQEKRSVERLSVYDFDTRAQRKAAPITGKSELEEDGSNVALVLKNLLEDEEKRRRFTNLIQYVLPFVSAVNVERFAGRSLIPTLEETHAPGTPLPASLLSEGTIKVISLLIALYFEEKPVIAFEEPASNLHPQLISRVVGMMKEQSAKEEGEKQIFVTTHSPEVIKHAGLENVYLVSRDEDGFSTVTKPAEKEEVAIFLENEMGLDNLFVQGLLDL